MSWKSQSVFIKSIKIVKAAYEAGADAIKLQTYTADTMTINSKKKFFKLLKKKIYGGVKPNILSMKKLKHHGHGTKIFDYAKKLGIICFSSPFDESSVDFLEKLNVKIYKIASFENDHYPF